MYDRVRIHFFFIFAFRIENYSMHFEVEKHIEDFMATLTAHNPGEKEFHQAMQEVVESLAPYITVNPQLRKTKILERIAEPERIIISDRIF